MPLILLAKGIPKAALRTRLAPLLHGTRPEHSHRVLWRGTQAWHTASAPTLRVLAGHREPHALCTTLARRPLGSRQFGWSAGLSRGCFQCHMGIDFKAGSCSCFPFPLTLENFHAMVSSTLFLWHIQQGGVWIWTSPCLLKCWMGSRKGLDTG